jgi:hypothetical protein
MPERDTGAGGGGQAGGLAADPRLLAAGAAGLTAAMLALWAVRGLPLGFAAFWAAPLPLFAAGIGFGKAAALLAVVLAVALVWLAGTDAAAWLFALFFGLPVVLLVFAFQPGRGLGLPMALLGLMPAGGIAAVAVWLDGTPAGFEGTLRALTEAGLRRLDLPTSSGLVDEVVRVKAAAIGFWLTLSLLANAWVAGKVLDRAGIAPAPAWGSARLPAWYLAAPGVALGLWLAAGTDADAAPLSILLVLLAPLVLHGLLALHARSIGRGGRWLLLGAVYAALVVMFMPASLAVAGYGAWDLLARRTPSQGGTGAPRRLPPE